ncbi:hypothetical protein [Hyperthermus butylicus]|uniref:Uncharacterized protein n=1 Tax=Hyperthermus butylicus (strain DSM 5456 / JCM 9403 / PLM1-5) TaxID=415426 RepID=A2BN45_HYPBU|nr:hypothetical protein [Hyperthermus butylicus]ABM81406.1 hypothetical protein Hbut_1586 [Hyperthermus butylicus DSM 5456]
MYRVVARTVLILLLAALLASNTVYATPSWAKEGNWAKYKFRMEISGEALTMFMGLDKMSIEGMVKVEIVSVDENGFTALSSLEDYKVEPETIAQMISTEMLNMNVDSQQHIEFSKEPSMVDMGFYVDPAKLPEDGKVELTHPEFGTITAVYDKETGWLLEAEARAEQDGMKTYFMVELLDSNFVGKGGGVTSNALLYGAIVGVVVVTLVAFITLKRKS